MIVRIFYKIVSVAVGYTIIQWVGFPSLTHLSCIVTPSEFFEAQSKFPFPISGKKT